MQQVYGIPFPHQPAACGARCAGPPEKDAAAGVGAADVDARCLPRPQPCSPASRNAQGVVLTAARGASIDSSAARFSPAFRRRRPPRATARGQRLQLRRSGAAATEKHGDAVPLAAGRSGRLGPRKPANRLLYMESTPSTYFSKSENFIFDNYISISTVILMIFRI